jgi:uncharacterized protein YqeY
MYNKTMNIKTQLENTLKEAMRSKDEPRKRTVRMALAAIRLAEIDHRSPLDEAGVLGVLQKEVKSRNESIADAQRAGRSDLVEENQVEIAILESFLPSPFSAPELEALVKEAIAEAGAQSVGDLGKVMRLLTPRLQGRATGAQASQVVRQLLQRD